MTNYRRAKIFAGGNYRMQKDKLPGGSFRCCSSTTLSVATDCINSPLQVDATCHSAFIQQRSLGIHYNQCSDLLDYLVDKTIFKFDSRFVKIPNGPGLGISIDEEHVKKWQRSATIGKIRYGGTRTIV
jgi:galactonate dehydratase